jgi:hypothetical protein
VASKFSFQFPQADSGFELFAEFSRQMRIRLSASLRSPDAADIEYALYISLTQAVFATPTLHGAYTRMVTPPALRYRIAVDCRELFSDEAADC